MLTVVDGNVSQARDKSGAEWHVSQPDTALRPTLAIGAVNGRNAIQWPSTPGDGFGGGGNAKRLFTSRSDTFTVSEIYAVVVFISAFQGGDPGIFSPNSNLPGEYPWLTRTGLTAFRNEAFDQVYLNGGSTNRITDVYPELSSTCLVRAKRSDGGAISTTSGLAIGMDRDYGYLGRGWRGYICELIAFPSPLSSGDSAALTETLRGKWGFP